MSQKNHPSKTFRCHNITGSIWQSEEPDKNGKKFVRYSVKIQKHYRKEDGNWADSHYFFPEDLPHLALVVQECFKFITLKESKDTTETSPV